VQLSAMLYCWLEFALVAWVVLNLFVFTDESDLIGGLFVAGPGVGSSDMGWINLIVSTLGTPIQYFWLGKISRQTQEAVRKHQITFA
jgi:hypothetical protein